jgi:predicted transcriptional regulator
MVTIGLKIGEELKAKLSEIAKREDRSISSVARLAIEEGLVFFDKGVPHQSKKNLTVVSPTIKTKP